MKFQLSGKILDQDLQAELPGGMRVETEFHDHEGGFGYHVVNVSEVQGLGWEVVRDMVVSALFEPGVALIPMLT